MSRNWMRLTHDAVMLGLEAQRVIGLRLIKLSNGGPAAQAEALRMVSEKTTALAEAGLTLARGGSAGSVMSLATEPNEVRVQDSENARQFARRQDRKHLRYQ